jgi:thioesterase domain-containing protein
MAQDYVSAVRAVQPTGPHHLVGYSLGGLVAYEMAKRLMAEGEQPGLIGIFDTIPSQRQWPVRLWLSVFGARAKHHANVLMRSPPWQWPAYCRARLKAFYPYLRWYWGRGRIKDFPAPMADLPPASRKVYEAGVLASSRYRLTRYPGEIVLFRAERRSELKCDPEIAWRGYAGTLTVRSVPGSHKTMLDEHAGDLAAAIRPFLPASRSEA